MALTAWKFADDLKRGGIKNAVRRNCELLKSFVVSDLEHCLLGGTSVCFRQKNRLIT